MSCKYSVRDITRGLLPSEDIRSEIWRTNRHFHPEPRPCEGMVLYLRSTGRDLNGGTHLIERDKTRRPRTRSTPWTSWGDNIDRRRSSPTPRRRRRVFPVDIRLTRRSRRSSLEDRNPLTVRHDCDWTATGKR